MITAQHRDKVVSYIDSGAAEGATLLTDGRERKVHGYPRGHWVGPTLFDHVTPEMEIYREEIFGPGCS